MITNLLHEVVESAAEQDPECPPGGCGCSLSNATYTMVVDYADGGPVSNQQILIPTGAANVSLYVDVDVTVTCSGSSGSGAGCTACLFVAFGYYQEQVGGGGQWVQIGGNWTGAINCGNCGTQVTIPCGSTVATHVWGGFVNIGALPAGVVGNKINLDVIVGVPDANGNCSRWSHRQGRFEIFYNDYTVVTQQNAPVC